MNMSVKGACQVADKMSRKTVIADEEFMQENMWKEQDVDEKDYAQGSYSWEGFNCSFVDYQSPQFHLASPRPWNADALIFDHRLYRCTIAWRTFWIKLPQHEQRETFTGFIAR